MWFRRKKEAPNYAEFLLALHKFASEDEADLMRDFRQVFLSTPQGKRVLYSILFWSGIYDVEPPTTDPMELNRIQGRKDLGAHLMRVTFAEFAELKETKRDDWTDPSD